MCIYLAEQPTVPRLRVTAQRNCAWRGLEIKHDRTVVNSWVLFDRVVNHTVGVLVVRMQPMAML